MLANIGGGLWVISDRIMVLFSECLILAKEITIKVSLMNRQEKISRWSVKLSAIAVMLSVLSILMHRLAFVDFKWALLGLGSGVIAGFLAVVSGLLGVFLAIRSRQDRVMPILVGPLLGLLVITPVVLVVWAGAGVPPIHDISTDLQDPPQFVAIKALRTSAHNPLDRKMPHDLAALQRAGYPDLAPALVNQPMDQVFEVAVLLVKKRGWEIVSVSVEEGRIEATDTTRFMGFRDDVVIRVQTADNLTRVDMRSASRVGKSDLGTNAGRIRHFLVDLQK